MASMVSTPGWHDEFYSDAFQRWASSRAPLADETFNVLVCGLADYAMLYWVAQSIEHSVRKRTVFHVLDICQTPLETCKWLEQRLHRCAPPMELEIRYHHCDILQNELPAANFDLITSDAFLTRFETPEVKSRILGEWIKLLKRGGRIITTARVRRDASDITESSRTSFIQRAVMHASERSLTPVEIKRAATDYAKAIESFPFPSEEALRQLMRQFQAQVELVQLKFKLLKTEEMALPYYARIELKRL